MIDYNKVSNTDIESEVAYSLGYDFDEDGPYVLDYSDIDSPYSDGEPVRIPFEPTVNAAQAFKIIAGCRISLIWLPTRQEWWANADTVTGKANHCDKNMLRAAMIVYLKLLDGKNE